MNGILDWSDSTPDSIKMELQNRAAEATRLAEEQAQLGTSTPQLYGSLGKFVSNPSTVTVETYKRMIDTDETIGAGVDFMITSMIARWGDYKHPIEQIEEFVQRALEGMDNSFHEYLEEIMSAEWAGFSATEKVWKFVKDFDGAPAFLPKDLVTYHPLTVVFACDRAGNLMRDGVYQYQRYFNPNVAGYAGNGGFGFEGDGLWGFRPDMLARTGDLPYPVRIAADLSYLTVPIPTSKMIICRSSITGKFRNPYGRSCLRRIYKNWVIKDAFLKMWLIAADRKGTPLVVGYADGQTTVLEQRQDAPGGVKGGVRADIAMANTFRTIHNSSFITLPGKKAEVYEVEAIQVTGDMNVFKDGVEYFNRAIMRGLLIPPLVMSAGDGAGSFALGQEHHKIFRQTIDGKNKPFKRAVLKEFIQQIIAYNFPRSMWEKEGYGDFVLEEFDPEVMEKLAQIYSTLTTDGYMSPSAQVDLDHVREKMGMEKKKAEPMDTNSESDPFGVKDVNDTNGLDKGPVDLILDKHEQAQSDAVMERVLGSGEGDQDSEEEVDSEQSDKLPDNYKI